MSRQELTDFIDLVVEDLPGVSSTGQERISAILGRLPYNASRAEGQAGLGSLSPYETMQNSGVCRDLATLGAYLHTQLPAHEREQVRLFGVTEGHAVREGGINHRFLSLPNSGSITDYGIISMFSSPADAVPGAFELSEYSVPTSIDDTSQIIGTTLTE